ncbi:hypothetical protein EXIGLDRAFT_782333 [Exidia glandulosa HHB12029]|uniref:AB hydrolase-1 domain-containing protein n=1 Tax=Exidia glandulosa HHB12029 TaxID=1314781 RepID=A0A165AVI0_EXIGL|nr:hypothetical protein EXIGLDRAFT_782333 [Exidia glandulosa HHB12029]
MIVTSVTFALVASALSALAATLPTPRCVDSIMHFPVSAKNFNLSSGTLPPGPPNVPVSGSYGIQLRYCEPSMAVHSRKDTIQVLVHGITYNTEYWDASFQPNMYSYVRFAAAQGYATLNMARIGDGKSDRPDPIKVVQSPLEVAVLVNIIKAARAGHIPGANRKFGTIVYAGHSYGSILLNGVVISEPKLVDAAIFTGYAHVTIDASQLSLQPARDNNPARFGHLPPDYITTTNASTRGADFYGPAGSFDPAALTFDEAHKDTATTGGLLTVSYTITTAPEFKGDVLTINGDQDSFFCPEPNCANIQGEGKFYPQARSVEAAVTSGAGHSLNYQITAQRSYGTIQAWLTRHGY